LLEGGEIAHRRVPPIESAAMSGRETILVADGQPRFLARTSDLLERDGHRLVTASDLTEARRALLAHRPQIVLAGELPGPEEAQALCVDVKRHDASTPCVLMLGGEAEAVAQAADRCGAETWLLRPLRPRELSACVRAMRLVARLMAQVAEGQNPPPAPTPAPGAASGILDPLTGLYTFGYFKEALYREVKRARRHAYPLGVILLCYDPKVVGALPATPASGTERGRLFRGLALAVKRSIREIDVAVSYNDDRVLILLPHTDLDGTVTVARRIRTLMKRSRVNLDGEALAATISVGLSATIGSQDVVFSALIKEASSALAFALDKGGNCIVY
jgi:diguanylate cyclase (GGDEF)-like protein